MDGRSRFERVFELSKELRLKRDVRATGVRARLSEMCIKRKGRDSNPQGNLIARPFSKRFPSPIGWPFPLPDPGTRAQSAQRDLNPRIRHGKAVDCRYLMSAAEVGLSKINRAPGGTRTHVTALRKQRPTAGRPVRTRGSGLLLSNDRREGNRTLDLLLIRQPL